MMAMPRIHAGNPVVLALLIAALLLGLSLTASAETEFQGTTLGRDAAESKQRPGTTRPPTKPVKPEGEPQITLEIASHWGGPVHGADIHGDYAYIANGRMLRILDISDETDPVEIGAIQLGTGHNGVRDVKVREGYAFVGADGEDFFSIIDVSDPTMPFKVRSFSSSTAGGAHAHTVALYGNHAYVQGFSGASGSSIRIYDIANPTQATMVGTLGSSITAFIIHDDHLYTGYRGTPMLRVYDLAANPVQPPQIGQLPNGWQVAAIAAEDDYLYIAAQNPSTFGSELITVHIGNPAAPALTNLITEGFDHFIHPLRVAASEGRLYLANPLQVPRYWEHYDTFHIYDIDTNPAQPDLLHAARPHGAVEAILAVGPERVYLWDNAEGFVILDTAGPLPERAGKYHSPTELRRMVKDGDLLYIADRWGGFTVLDVSDLQQPQVVGTYLARRHADTGIDAVGIAKAGDRIYLTAGYSGLMIVDVSNPAQPTTVGVQRVTTVPFAPGRLGCAKYRGVTVDNDIAYVGYYYSPNCLGYAVLMISVDVIDPINTQPLTWVQLGSTGVPRSNPDSITRFNTHFLTVNGHNSIIDISIPSDMQPVYGPAPPDPTVDIAVADDWIRLLPNNPLAMGMPKGLYIQDVTVPSNPLPLAFFGEDDIIPGCGVFPHDLVAVDTFHTRAFVYGQGRLLALDLTDPVAPVCEAELDGLHGGGDSQHRWSLLAPTEDEVFITSRSAGLSSVRVHDPVRKP